MLKMRQSRKFFAGFDTVPFFVLIFVVQKHNL